MHRSPQPSREQDPHAHHLPEQGPREQDPREQDLPEQDLPEQGRREQDPREQDLPEQDPREQDPREQDPREQDPRERPGSYLSAGQLARDLAIPDLSDPADGPHAIQLIAALAVDGLVSAWQQAPPAVRWCRGPRIVPVADNYDNLGYDPADVTRAARYTRYVDQERMLRSHSTALVPPALRQLAAEQSAGPRRSGGPARSAGPGQPAGPGQSAGLPADVLLACPGICYRRDAIDRQHTGTPQQLDLWRVTSTPRTTADLDQMVGALLAAVLPGRPSRQLAREHPYTTGGRQVDVWDGTCWVEIAECGLADPAILARAGLPGYSGLAIGIGLDRMLMLAKGIPDIRLLRSADPRVAAQLQDLAPYRPVSRQPPVRRDLSVAVDAADDDETLGDRVREALGPDADAVEEVAVLSETRADALPPAAIARLGLRPGQRNLLIRVVLRRLDATLTDAQATDLRDRIYAAIHQGSRQQLASRR